MRFQFNTEDLPPHFIGGWFFQGADTAGNYKFSTFGLGNSGFIKATGFTDTLSTNEATNNFFTSFKTDTYLEINLTPGNLGGSRDSVPPTFVNIHAYLQFVFS